MNFFLSFMETLLHSIWQAALLLGIYWVINIVERNYHPLHKRNFLYLLLLSQLAISIFTFLSFFEGDSFAVTIGFTNALKENHFVFLNNYYSVIFTVYMAIVLIKFAQIIFQWSIFKNDFSNNILKPTASLNLFTKYHSHQLSSARPVTLWFSNNLKTPLTFGFLKPVILLPVSLINNITTEQAEIIILHELIHIKNHDYLFNWFLITMETLYFFNPFIKITAEKLKLEREKNCDIQVLNYQFSSIHYAETLYETARNNSLKRFQLGIFKNNAQLYKRISFFSDERNLSFKKMNYPSLIIGLFVIMGMMTFLMISKTLIPTNEPMTRVIFHGEKYQTTKVSTLPINYTEKSVAKKNIAPNIENAIVAKTIKPYKTPSLNVLSDDDANIYRPVSLKENADSTKEVIYYVEDNTTTITQSYKVINRNGIVVFEPQWMIKVTKDTTSSKIKIDSTVLLQPKEIQ